MSGSRKNNLAAGLAMAALLFLEGCTGAYDEGYKAGYKEGYAGGLDQGYQAGASDGTAEGEIQGVRRAGEAAASGTSWRFYLEPFAFSCAAGTTIGVILQYALIYAFRRTYHLSWLGTALVPGMPDSKCFRLQAQLGLLSLEKSRHLEEVKSRAEIKTARIEAIRSLARRQIEARSDLESVLLKRILADAEKEMQRIVEEAEQQQAPRSSHRREHGL